MHFLPSDLIKIWYVGVNDRQYIEKNVESRELRKIETSNQP